MVPLGRPGASSLALLAAAWLSTVCADSATTYPTSVRGWELESQIQMSITSEGSVIPITYTVLPLTTDLGLNESQTDRGQIDLEGKLVLADASTYTNISGSDAIPYLSCDDAVNSVINANAILNSLMSKDPQPQAILLYSQRDQSCTVSGQNLNFRRLLTMSDTIDASDLGNITANAAGTARATITGNITTPDQEQGGQQDGNNSAVAMSILYSITGLITLLFLVIIATGAIRAHRYPERYGPRSGFGGRPRQSRAKGLARAVLETLPIVKFGDTQPAKPDPDVELENASHQPLTATEAQREVATNGSQRHLSTIPESPMDPVHNVEVVGALRASNDTSAPSAGEGTSGTHDKTAGVGNDEGLGCSICTEDFAIGEDVRVLPCNHKYHPACIDPWLVNMSSTCPLCRLDLRPEDAHAGQQPGQETRDAPLGAEGNEAGDSSNSSRRRSRFFDLARLRHAPVEERLEALRRIRSEQQPDAPGPASAEEESRRRAKLSDRLRERFNIRTRTAQQAPGQAGTAPTIPDEQAVPGQVGTASTVPDGTTSSGPSS